MRKHVKNQKLVHLLPFTNNIHSLKSLKEEKLGEWVISSKIQLLISPRFKIQTLKNNKW